MFHWNRNNFMILILGPSAEEKELIGTWENDVDGLEFKDNGDLIHQGGLYDGWSVSGNDIPSQILVTRIMNGFLQISSYRANNVHQWIG